MKNAAILILLVLLYWFGSTIVELENYGYASTIGMCSEFANPLERVECLQNTETRTHWIFHLLYSLNIL